MLKFLSYFLYRSKLPPNFRNTHQPFVQRITFLPLILVTTHNFPTVKRKLNLTELIVIVYFIFHTQDSRNLSRCFSSADPFGGSRWKNWYSWSSSENSWKFSKSPQKFSLLKTKGTRAVWLIFSGRKFENFERSPGDWERSIAFFEWEFYQN